MPEQAADLNAVGEPFRIGKEHFTTKDEVVEKHQRTADYVEAVEACDSEINRVVGIPSRCEFRRVADLLTGDRDVREGLFAASLVVRPLELFFDLVEAADFHLLLLYTHFAEIFPAQTV